MFEVIKMIFFFGKFTSLQIQLSDLVETRKQNYHIRQTEKLGEQNTSPKVYWSLLKTFLNNKKIPCIPPIFYENDFLIDFQKKVEIFNRFFAKQCIVVPNFSKLPSVFIISSCFENDKFPSELKKANFAPT